MKEYKLVLLNEELHLSRKKDIEEAELTLNRYIREGWTLQQITTPTMGGSEMIAVLYKENDWLE